MLASDAPLTLTDLNALGERLLAAIARLADQLLDVSHRLGRLEAAQVEHDRRLLLLEHPKPRRKTRKKSK